MDILDRFLIQEIILHLRLRTIDECEIQLGYLQRSMERRYINMEQVVEEITKEDLAKKVGDRKGSGFVEDVTIPEKFRARLRDYFRSGYDRGHQVQKFTSKIHS